MDTLRKGVDGVGGWVKAAPRGCRPRGNCYLSCESRKVQGWAGFGSSGMTGRKDVSTLRVGGGGDGRVPH